jgi:putative AdoMet-dependent methyltransferase
MPEEWKNWDFDEYADDYDAWVASDDPIYARYDDVLRFVVQLAAVKAGMTVLDIGTGTANLALRLATEGTRVVGVDPSRRMLARASAKIGDGAGIELKYLEQPFLDLPFPDDRFDAVVSTYSFHHIAPPLKSEGVREMVRVLKPGRPWVLGDLIFRDARSQQQALAKYEWLEDEYYPRIEELRPVFSELGMELHSQELTPITWVLWALKPAGSA